MKNAWRWLRGFMACFWVLAAVVGWCGAFCLHDQLKEEQEKDQKWGDLFKSILLKASDDTEKKSKEE